MKKRSNRSANAPKAARVISGKSESRTYRLRISAGGPLWPECLHSWDSTPPSQEFPHTAAHAGGWRLEVGSWRLVSGRLVAFGIEMRGDSPRGLDPVCLERCGDQPP